MSYTENQIKEKEEQKGLLAWSHYHLRGRSLLQVILSLSKPTTEKTPCLPILTVISL